MSSILTGSQNPFSVLQDFEGLVLKMMVDRTTRSWSQFDINVIFHNKSLISRVEAHKKWLMPKLVWLHLTQLSSNVEWICRLVNKSCRQNCRYIVATCLFSRSSTSITGQQCRQMTGFHCKTSHTGDCWSNNEQLPSYMWTSDLSIASIPLHKIITESYHCISVIQENRLATCP